MSDIKSSIDEAIASGRKTANLNLKFDLTNADERAVFEKILAVIEADFLVERVTSSSDNVH